ncbi:MAG: ParB N-terminal domain-containing protein [Planctomycetota bacterium]|nr:ParB N-terminal domain-containing protein [Planctomycetota bacterium]
MKNVIQSISLDRLIAHPDNPNRMSKGNFSKLVRNIERTSLYEPLTVRRHGENFQIINGHHRLEALKKLGYAAAECVVWDVDDEHVDILLATLNRHCGSDILDKKLILLRRLNEKMQVRELSRLLPLTGKQIERLANLKLPALPVKAGGMCFAVPLVFFVNESQQRIIEEALSKAQGTEKEKTKAQRRSEALTKIAEKYLK